MRTFLVALGAALLAPVLAAQERELVVVDVAGSAYERGLEHGRRLKAEIAGLLRDWKRELEKGSDVGAEEFIARFHAATEFEAAARRHTPELLDEIRGIAEGAGQAYEEMFVYQLIDEQWAQSELGRGEKCSTIGVDRDGDAPGFVAQNLDLPRWMGRYPTVLRIDHGDGLRSLVVTIPGLVGANGLNSARVAVGVNTILQIRPRPDGLPVAFVVRGLLAQRSHDDALAFLNRVEHASGQAYTVGGPDRSPCFEASAGGVVRWQPEGRDGWTWHTNHPLVSTDWSPRHVRQCASRGVPVDRRQQCSRFDALDRALPAGQHPTLEQVKAALRIHGAATPVCNPMTYVCTVMVLGEEPELHVTPGQPTAVPFEVVRLR